MKVSNLKVLCSSPTMAGIEKLINEYFFSSSYKLAPIYTTKAETYEIIGKYAPLCGFIVRKERKRYKFYQLN
jgi:hypothetical protein